MFEQDVRLGPGTGNFTSHSWEILIMLLGAFLLGLMLGYILWSRYKQEAEKLRLEHASLLATSEVLRKELADSKLKLSTVEEEASNYASQLSSLSRNNSNLRERLNELEEDMDETLARNRQVETELGLSLSAPSAVTDIPLEIELPMVSSDYPNEETGVGNTVEEMPVPQNEIVLPLADMPENASISEDPSILNDLDMTHDIPAGGVSAADDVVIQPVIAPSPTITVEEDAPTPETIDVEAETLVVPVKKRKGGKTKSDDDVAILGAVHDDDLTVVEGIGPKIQMLLNQYGIRSYRQLAETDVARLKEILAAAGPQLAMHDPGTWPSQANLAANDQWEALKSIQGFLKGGKTPD
jgi:predicted flap endonuclease-1-like 5' DNA nuclease